MNHDEPFERLARREVQFDDVARRGRRRSLAIMALSFVAVSALTMALNPAMRLAELIAIMGPIAIGSLVYSWRRWRRHPEDSQSVAFVGLDRASRRAAYRSMRRRSRVEDPVVLTMLESMHDHLRRTFPMIVAGVVVAAAMGVTLVQSSGAATTAVPISTIICVVAVLTIVQQRWMVRRAAHVIERSRHDA